MANREQILFEAKLDIAEASKRAAQLQKNLANLTEQQTLLKEERRRLNKQLKEALQAEKDAIASKEALRKKVVELQSAEGDNAAEIDKLTAEIAALSDQQNAARAAAEQYSTELSVTNSNLKDISKAIRETEKDFRAFPGTLQDQRNELVKLKQQYANFRVGIDGTSDDLEKLKTDIKELNDSISEQEQDVGVYSRNVGNYTESIKKAFNELPGPVGKYSNALQGLKDQFKELKKLGPTGLAIAGVAAIGAATAAVIKYGTEIDKTREKVEQLTGAQGEQADQLTASITATASTFNQEATEIVKSSNAFFQEFQNLGVQTQTEAAGLIRKGFAAGADASGEFLDLLREYPSQLREIGLNGEQAIALISQQPKTGVFSDKGVDAIKEANLRIRELPNATREALEAINLDSKKIEEDLRTGQTTTFEVIQSVSEKLSEFPPQSREVGKAIADIFGSAGEDAGLRYLQTLKDIDLNLDNVIESAGGMAEANLRISDATERINLQFARLFSGSNETFAQLKADALEFVANGLEKIVNGVVSLINFFIDLYNESTLVRGVWETLRAVGVTLFQTLRAQAKSFFSFFKDAGRVIGAVLKGEFSSIGDILEEGREERAAIAAEGGKKIGEAWTRALKNTVERGKVELISLTSDDTESVEKQYEDAGKRAAQAFKRGVENETVKPKVKVEPVDVDFGEIQSIGIDLETFAKQNNERLKLDKSYFEQRLEEQRLALEKEKAELELSYDENDTERIERETELNETLRELRKQQLEFQLDNLRKGSAEALEIELELIALRKEANDEEAEADQKRIREGKEIEEERRRLANVALSNVQDATEGIVEAFGEQSAAGKAAIAIQKAATAAQIGINLREQISNAITTGSQIAKIPGVGPILGTIYTATTIAGYTSRAAGLLAELAGFEGGGTTDGPGTRVFINSNGELVSTSNLTFEGRNVRNVGSFAGGGDVGSPTIGLIGERGPEYVVPNRVLKTKEGQQRVAELESIRKNMISRFELGGFTATPPSDPAKYETKNPEILRLARNLERLERQLEQQKQLNDSDSLRISTISAIEKDILEMRKSIIATENASTTQNAEVIAAITSDNSKIQETERRVELYSRQLEAIQAEQYSDLLFSSFVSNESQPIFPSFLASQTDSVGALSELASIDRRPTFPDGVVSSPVLAPLGDPAYVVPNFVLSSPEAQTSLQAVENIRTRSESVKTNVVPFALGGPTGSVAANPSFSPSNPTSGSDGSGIIEAIKELPRPVVLVEDIRNGVNRAVDVENESGL